MSPVSGPTVTPEGQSIAALGEHRPCPDCGVSMAPDQRYCLSCGHRRGEPRLPFMGAVVSVDSPGGTGRIPPPPRSRRSSSPKRWNPNAVLIAGVAALALAIGIGFLIGRAGHEGSPSASHGTQRVIIEGRGEAAPVLPEGPSTGHGPESVPQPGGKAGHGSPGHGSATKHRPESGGSSREEEVGRQKTREALHPTRPMAKPKAKVGESCEQGTAGCGKNHKWIGEFFGAEE